MKVRALGLRELAWFIDKTGYDAPPGFRGLVALGDDGQPRGVVGFDRWTPASASVHVAAQPTALRLLLREGLGYVFGQCGRKLVRGEVRESNGPVRRMAVRMGFTESGRVEGGWSEGEALVLYELRREQCRWKV